MSNGTADPELEKLLEYLHTNRGFDFTAYKRPTLGRRIQRRMQTVAAEHYSDYVDYLEVHPEEFTELFNTILINVTGFFRDPPTWDYVREEVVPRIIEGKDETDPIRLWSAATSSGEEAFTLAMILAEVMGERALGQRVKIYATDIDEDALNSARAAVYPLRALQGVPAPLIEKYFEVNDATASFRKELRRVVIFGRHDLLHDAPISRIDLLTCRNALMYFNAEAQMQAISRLIFALNNSGYLLLGKSESMLTHVTGIAPVSPKLRLFVKEPRRELPDRLPVHLPDVPVADPMRPLRDVAFDVDPVAAVIIDLNGYLILANERARDLLDLHPRDVGKRIQDMEFSYRPVELRSLIDEAVNQRRPVYLRDVGWPAERSEVRWIDIQVLPLGNGGRALLGTKLVFTDVTRYRRLQDDLELSKRELESAYEELQSTNEELETTNEELQSTVEELETTNEELQSTNEELETMNEELQSSNEELETVNAETRERSTALSEVNDFLESILTSMRVGVIVVDNDLLVRAWNSRAEDLWGLRQEEVQGKHLLNLEFGLPIGQLRDVIRDTLSGASELSELTIPATNRRGRAIECRVTVAPLHTNHTGLPGAMLTTEDVDQHRVAGK